MTIIELQDNIAALVAAYEDEQGKRLVAVIVHNSRENGQKHTSIECRQISDPLSDHVRITPGTDAAPSESHEAVTEQTDG